MAHLNWSKLNGAEFESLVQTMLWALYPGVRGYGRPGRDSAMDAISADGSHLYQAKFIQSQKMSEAISRAKTEAETIEKYKKGNGARADRLKAIKEWTLAGTFLKNPDDEDKWNTVVVQKFKSIGIDKVHFWGIEDLEPMLHRIPEVRDSYFEDSNRPFLLLPEVAAKLDSEINGEFFEKMPLIGREAEIKQIIDFINDASCRFVVIDGVEGQGKTKLLFEAAIFLQELGWRVIWGMPITMNASDNWSRSINTCDQVCLIVEDLDDARLLQKILDQISVREKYTWKVVVTCDSSIAGVLLSRLLNKKYARRLTLHNLDDSAISEIIKSWEALCQRDYQVAEAAKIKSLARGLPGLTCFILANLVSVTQDLKLGVSHELFDRLWASMLTKFDGVALEKVKCTQLLCWLAMWRILVINPGINTPNENIDFLAGLLNVESSIIVSALDELAERKVLATWGANSIYYALEPSIMRQVVVSKVLFRRNDTKWEVSDIGRGLISALLQERVPASESIIATIGTFSSIYLDESRKVDFVAPVFNAIKELTKSGSLESCGTAIYWLSKIGKASPAAGIELLHDILVNEKADEEIGDGWGGKITLTHNEIISRIPECLYIIAPYAVSARCAKQCWRLMEELMVREIRSVGEDCDTHTMLYYFKRLVTGDDSNEIYADLALQKVVNELPNAKLNEISQGIVLALSDPRRVINGMASPFTIFFGRRLIKPTEMAWKRVLKIRNLLYTGLRKDNRELRVQSIQLLGKIHGLWDSTICLDKPKASELLFEYINVLENDLQEIKNRMENRALELDFSEANAARKIWESHLEERSRASLSAIAQICEEIYKRFSPFDFAKLLEWKTRNERAPELDKVYEKFKSARMKGEIAAFFADMKVFLSSEGGGRYDNFNAIGDIAERCCDLFLIDAVEPNPYTDYVFQQLATASDIQSEEFRFVVQVLRKYMRNTRPRENAEDWVASVFSLIGGSPIANKLFVAIYCDMPPDVIGDVSLEEVESLLHRQGLFSREEKLSLSPLVLKFGTSELVSLVESEMEEIKKDQEEFDKQFNSFSYHLYLTCLRCDYSKDQIPVDWLVPYLIDNYADGKLFASHDLYWLIDASGKRFGNALFARFCERRMVLEEQESPYPGFSLEPHGIEINKFFCNDHDEESMGKVCSMVVSRYSYVTSCMLPTYIAALDINGDMVAAYTVRYIDEHPEMDTNELVRVGNLAAAYDDMGEAWGRIVKPICERINSMFLSEADRARIFASFRPKTWFHSSNIGEIPDDIVDRYKQTRRMVNLCPAESAMREYWEWAFVNAQREYESARDEAEAERHE